MLLGQHWMKNVGKLSLNENKNAGSGLLRLYSYAAILAKRANPLQELESSARRALKFY